VIFKATMDIDSIFKAASKNDSDALRKAIEGGIDPNIPHPKAGTLLLQTASRANAIESMKVLLDGGADPSRTTTRKSRVDGRVFENHVALMYAASADAARILIEAGAQVEAKDEKHWTPLAYAAHAGDVERFKYLLSCGADPSVLIGYDQRLMPMREMLQIMIGEWSAAVEQNGRSDLLPEIDRLRVIRDILVETESRSL
jgi:ankyrin repeat protein